MHYRVSRGDEHKVVKGKVAYKTDIYWVARSSHNLPNSPFTDDTGLET